MRVAPRVLPAAVPRPWWGIAYFGIYLAYLFVSLEGELLHWISLVLLPLVLTVVALRLRGACGSVAEGLELLGLRRGHWTDGLLLAGATGVALGLAQLVLSRQRAAFLELVATGEVLWLLPLSFALMLVTAAFTEEFFFRGFLQTHVEAATRSRLAGLLVTSVLFGLYHVPYAYLNPSWPSAGDLGAAFGAAMGQGVPGGIVLGAVFLLSNRNLVAPVVVHAAINAFPVTTMLHFGGGGG